jgi:sugar lactone lactonase YvrE
MSTPFNVATMSYTGNSLAVSTQETFVRSVKFSADGTKLFITGNQEKIFIYSLSTAWDLSTASYTSTFFDLSTQIPSTATSMDFAKDGEKLYVSSNSSDKVFEYSLKTPSIVTGYQPVHTTASTDTTYWTDINSMTADQNAGNGNVYYAISTDDRTTWSVIDNTDGERDIVRNNAGTWQYNSNATYASETWTNATTNTELAALAEAMEGASETVGYSLADASYDSITFATTSQAASPRGVAFKSDGSKMYVLDYPSKAIYQYSLSTAWNQSTATYDSVSFGVSSQTPNSGFGLEFKPDGTAFYIADNSTNVVYQYTLSTAWDLSTASYSSNSFDTTAQDSDTSVIKLGNSGTRLYVLGRVNDTVYQYSLSTAYDVSTASYDSKSFSVASQETNQLGMAFNPSGTKMFIVGSSSDIIYEYDISTAWDISTASYNSVNFSVASEATTPIDITFEDNGTKLYLIDYGNDQIERYSTSSTSYTNQMDKTQLDAVTDPNHIALGNDLDLAIVFNMTSGTTVPSSDGVAINYDANVLNKGAVLGTDYDFDAPTQNSVRITALAANNLKVRVV